MILQLHRKILRAVGCGIVPAMLLWAYTSGPDAHRTGVPGTNEKTCNDVGCHLGTALNGGGGSVTLTSSGGSTYTSGQKQTLTIRITDSAARVFGFQVTARLQSDHSKQAGTFTPGTRQFVLCASTNLNDLGNNRPNSGTCPVGQPLEFIEHTQPFTSGTITVDWTPPPSASGTVDIYVSANAANGNGAETGDHIYTTSLTLFPSGVVMPPPSITSVLPQPLVASSVQQTLTFSGSGFQPGLIARLRTPTGSVVSMNPTSVSAQAFDLSAAFAAGGYVIQAINPSGTQSGEFGFVVTAPPPPSIFTVSPSKISPSSSAQVVSVTGFNFQPGALVKIGLTNVGTFTVPTTFISANTLQVSYAFTTSGAYSLQVVNVDGQASVVYNFAVAIPGPIVTAVVNGASFLSPIQDGSWITIQGANLAPNTAAPGRLWNGQTEIINGVLPTALDGVSVMVDGKIAPMYFVSDNQLNVLAPATGKIGPVQVVVINALGSSAPVTAQVARYSPALFVFTPRYPAALNADGTYLGPSGLISGAVVRPAKAGDTIVLYGTGLGPTSPEVPVGSVFVGAASTVDPVLVTIGGIRATVRFAGLSAAGLYQINVVVPDFVDGEYGLSVTVGALQVQNGFFVPVRN